MYRIYLYAPVLLRAVCTILNEFICVTLNLFSYVFIDYLRASVATITVVQFVFIY